MYAATFLRSDKSTQDNILIFMSLGKLNPMLTFIKQLKTKALPVNIFILASRQIQ